MKNIFILLAMLSVSTAFAQNKDSVAQSRDSVFREFELEAATIAKQRFVVAKGFTKDDKGRPLPGVIITHGSGNKKRQTVSDEDGYFRLDSVRASSSLVRFMKPGYATLAFFFGKHAQIEEVRLAFDPSGINQEVDFGIFKVSKMKAVFALKSIQGETLRRYASGKLSMSLSGVLGSGWEYVSLIMFNGMPVDVDPSGRTRESAYRFVDSLNPYDIEAIAYMPPGAQTAIFGARGAGGVLAIKLKTR